MISDADDNVKAAFDGYGLQDLGNVAWYDSSGTLLSSEYQFETTESFTGVEKICLTIGTAADNSNRCARVFVIRPAQDDVIDGTLAPRRNEDDFFSYEFILENLTYRT